MRHLLAKFFADIDYGDRSVFYGIVQQPSRDGGRIDLHVCQNQSYFEGMHQVGFAGRAGLSGMMLQGEFIRLFYDLQSVGRAALPHPTHQFREFGHRERGGRDLFPQSRHNGL